MKTLNMVFSAPSMLRLCQFPHYKNNEVFTKFAVWVIGESIKMVKERCNQIIPEANTNISILYNAYTEVDIGELLNNNSKFGFDYVLADSGGLQVVTLGKEMNYELMQNVYSSQAKSDFAMAFDEIPARNAMATGRANTNVRIYYPELANECAIKTAKNINEQAQYFKDNNSNASVMFITQGNNMDDVIEWFNTGFNIIDKTLWDERIAGMALAGSCIGNGEQETIENFLAYLKLVQQHGQDVMGNIIHLLGYGSVARLVPCISLFLSDIMQDELILSFDSSSLSMSLMMGKFITADGKAISTNSETDARIAFTESVEFFKPLLSKAFGDVDYDELINHLVENRKSMSKITDNEVPIGNKLFDICKIFATMYAIYQTIGLWQGIRTNMQEHNIISSLCSITDLDEMVNFYYANNRHFKSSRITRNNPSIDFVSLFS